MIMECGALEPGVGPLHHAHHHHHHHHHHHPYLLAESAAAGSIGFINSVGNLGGFIGPWILGRLDRLTGSYTQGLGILAGSLAAAATIILALGVGRGTGRRGAAAADSK